MTENNGEQLDISFDKDPQRFKLMLTELKSSVDVVDKNGMSLLQHACFIGDQECVRLLLDRGADPNYSEAQSGAVSGYTALHFAAIAGKSDIVFMLMEAGANPKAQNSVSRTPSQMAAFVGNHHCVSTINSFIPKSNVSYYTRLQGQQTQPYLPPYLLNSFHKFIIQVNLHPVRIVFNLQKYSGLLENLPIIKKVLAMMSKRELEKMYEDTEIRSFKLHYFGCIVDELMRCQQQFPDKYIDRFIKRVLKENVAGQLDYFDYIVKHSLKEFPFHNCKIYHAMIAQLTSPDILPYEVLRNAINGIRGFNDSFECSTCGVENATKNCLKCNQAYYCDADCQKLHWFQHKKKCEELAEKSVHSTMSELKIDEKIEEHNTKPSKENDTTECDISDSENKLLTI